MKPFLCLCALLSAVLSTPAAADDRDDGKNLIGVWKKFEEMLPQGGVRPSTDDVTLRISSDRFEYLSHLGTELFFIGFPSASNGRLTVEGLITDDFKPGQPTLSTFVGRFSYRLDGRRLELKLLKLDLDGEPDPGAPPQDIVTEVFYFLAPLPAPQLQPVVPDAVRSTPCPPPRRARLWRSRCMNLARWKCRGLFRR